MDDNTVLYASLLCAAASLVLVSKWRSSSDRPHYPPGPKGYPFIGSVLDVPRGVPIWKGLSSVAQDYNTDVLYIKLFSKNFVVLNSSEAISDLLDKRSTIYSDRAPVPMFELMDAYSWGIPVLGYGNRWKRGRRLFHEFFNGKATTSLDDWQRKYAYRFLSLLAETPDDFLDHAKFVIGALVLEITYNLDIKSHGDRYLQAAEHAMEYSERVMVPGAFLVDTFPILKHVPEWFPGAGFKHFAKEGQKAFEEAVDRPLEYTKRSLKSNGSDASFASMCFERIAELRDQGFEENDIRAVTSSTYVAAADTTTTVLKSFFLVMTLHPHVMRKAQEELDRVVGNERLPEPSDKENLPYISALMKEVLRWSCPLPFGIPKRVMEDDTYKGYFIPAGTNILENIWTVCYNEVVYPEPQIYDPERFMKDGKLNRSVLNPEERVFGSGRRICPGKQFGLQTLFLNIACTLAVFDILAPAGEKLEAKYSEGFIRHPPAFKCVIKPRSAASLKLVMDACAIFDSS